MMLILCCAIAYLLGSIPFSYILGKQVKGIDLRDYGSGNLGATNVFRNLGPWWGGLCLFLDMAKGAGAVILMSILVAAWPESEPTPLHLPPDIYRILAGFLAAIGHTFSPFIGFKGGKGVATTAGAFVVLEPFPIVIATVIFIAVLAVTRIVSLASICAAVIFPIATGFFEYQSTSSFSKTLFVFSCVISVWVLYKHRANLRRLSTGEEKPLSSGNKEKAEPEPTDEPPKED